MPDETEESLLPRRVRLVLEFERPVDRARRTRTLAELGESETSFEVENAARLPTDSMAYILIEAEWMKLVGFDGDRVKVLRAQRGSDPRPHAAGALVHHGVRVTGEIPIELHDDSWNL